MTLLDLVRRFCPPEPWAEGENIPWNDPAFSRRMLAEHLSQSHDMASRRAETIDRHVQWMHGELLGGKPTRVLDLGCGPGLYASRLSMKGHDCLGIDYGPASIEYARQHAQAETLACEYMLADVREAKFGDGFGLAMMVFGEFNVFPPEDARKILAKSQAALNEGGLILLEAHTLAAVEKIGSQPRSWRSAEPGLFSDKPHVCMQEGFWDGDGRTATVRFFIVDAATGQVTRHAASYQGYGDDQYDSLLTECGFRDVKSLPALTGSEDGIQEGLKVIVAAKQ